MQITGEFINKKGKRVKVDITTHGDTSTKLEIGTDTLWFADSPVTIESQASDTFDVLLAKQATIRLLSRDYIQDLYCSSPLDAHVEITQDGQGVFKGFLEPQAYSQDYNSPLDEIELSCIDVLTVLKYRKYKGAGDKGVDYNTLRQSAGVRTFASIIESIIAPYTASAIYHDASKAVDASQAKRATVFGDLSLNEMLFLGDDEDDVWTEEDVVTELLRYLNLHMVQEGGTFYIFSWETLRAGKNITWYTLDGNKAVTDTAKLTTISLDIAEDADTKFEIGETYSQIKLTCDLKSVDDLVESPLDSASLVSPFRSKQRYCDEYISEFKSKSNDGMIAALAFNGMLEGLSYDYDKAWQTKWFAQIKQSKKWAIGRHGEDYIAKYCAEGTQQQTLLQKMRTELMASLVSLGKVENKANKQDNSPIASVDMTDYLVISVNGNGVDIDTDTAKVSPSADELLAASPVATYTGNNSGAVLTPPDPQTTNYIVISGSILLNPLKVASDGTAPYPYEVYKAWADQGYTNKDKPFTNSDWLYVPGKPVEIDDGDYKNMWYAPCFLKADTPLSQPQVTTDTALLPPSSPSDKRCKFNYSAVGDSADHISKVAVLACMLVVGDKCVVETGTEGKPSDFTWQTFKERSQCKDDDEFYSQCFTIGINPKIGDYLIGEEHDIQNNIDYTMGLDVEGTAIPIKFGSGISGRVRFMILGAVNTTWGEVTRRHPTWFRHTKWSTKDIALLSHVSSIFVKKLEVKIHSDNAFISNDSNDELVYMSDTAEGFQNKKDDINFKLCTALTSSEREKYGISDTVQLTTPQLANGTALLSIYDVAKGETAKPEQDYIDSYYNEYSKPRIVLSQAVTDRQMKLGEHYKQEALGKSFFIQSADRDIAEGVATLKLKEI